MKGKEERAEDWRRVLDRWGKTGGELIDWLRERFSDPKEAALFLAWFGQFFTSVTWGDLIGEAEKLKKIIGKGKELDYVG